MLWSLGLSQSPWSTGNHTPLFPMRPACLWHAWGTSVLLLASLFCLGLLP